MGMTEVDDRILLPAWHSGPAATGLRATQAFCNFLLQNDLRLVISSLVRRLLLTNLHAIELSKSTAIRLPAHTS